MKAVRINPARFKGSVSAPPSKSFLHRALICSYLSFGNCTISPVSFSDDILATINGLKAFGADITVSERGIVARHSKFGSKLKSIDCFDSGSTLRFLIAVAACLGQETVFKRSKELSKRPIEKYLEVLSSAGIKCSILKDLSIEIRGKLSPGKFLIPGNISSQFVSGLLMALPILEGDSKIELTSELESAKYVDMTVNVMRDYGVKVERTAAGFYIPGNQKYQARDYKIEGDWSQAAFFLAAGALGEKVIISGLNRDSLQGDKRIFDLISRFGADIFWDCDDVVVRRRKLSGLDIDAGEFLDIVPVLAVVAACAKGVTNIFNISRLKLKECDRLSAIYNELKKLGIKIEKTDSSLSIFGGGRLKPAKLSSYGDHRMAMALSVIAAQIEEGATIVDCGCVKKSYPNFFEDYNLVGGKANVFDLGE